MAPIRIGDPVDGDVRLRQVVDDDVGAITRICQDPGIQRWTRVPSPYSTEHAEQFVALSADALDSGEGVHVLAVDVDDGRVLGAVGLSVIHADLSGELGYWVAAEERGRGVATRASRLLCRLAFEQLLLGYVGLMAAADNDASNGVARRLGCTHEGTRRRAMIAGASGDPRAPRGDAEIWGLLPGELR